MPHEQSQWKIDGNKIYKKQINSILLVSKGFRLIEKDIKNFIGFQRPKKVSKV